MREFIARNDLTWRRPPDNEAVEMVERLAGREIDEADFRRLARELRELASAPTDGLRFSIRATHANTQNPEETGVVANES
jgi:hypothetical protein